MQEGLSSEHGSELFRNSLENFLDGRRVADEGGAHGEVARGHVADGSLHVVRDPLDEEPEATATFEHQIF